jgi:hypothetical protein
MLMPHYHIWPKDDPIGESYWVFAASPAEARRLVARNVPDVTKAEDGTKFLCKESSQKTPPAHHIHRRLDGAIPIINRQMADPQKYRCSEVETHRREGSKSPNQTPDARNRGSI